METSIESNKPLPSVPPSLIRLPRFQKNLITTKNQPTTTNGWKITYNTQNNLSTLTTNSAKTIHTNHIPTPTNQQRQTITENTAPKNQHPKKNRHTKRNTIIRIVTQTNIKRPEQKNNE